METTMTAWNVNRVITKVNTRFGSPMGRYNVGSKPKQPTKIYDKRVPMIDGAYDKGGAYWGIGRELRVRFTADLSYIEFYRLN